MRWRIVLLLVTVCFLFSGVLPAQQVDSTLFDQRFAQLELPPPANAAVGAPAGTPVIAPANAAANGSMGTPASGTMFVAPPAYGPDAVIVSAPPQTTAVVQHVEPVCSDSPYRNAAWIFGLDFIPMRSHFTEDEFGGWTDDSALALRLELGYENVRNIGVRGRFWGFTQEVDTPAVPLELSTSSFSIDFYKRFFIEDSELVLGAGPTGGTLTFEFPDFEEETQFAGGGASVFAEGFVPLVRFAKTDLGFVARTRLTLLEGRWDETVVPFIMETDNDSMEVLELAWGVELRHRFGWRQDRHFFVRVVPEFQRWESTWLGAFTGSSVAFVGTDISLGLAW